MRIAEIRASEYMPMIRPESPENQLMAAMKAQGLSAPSVTLDGLIHRFSTGSQRDDDSGWYVGFTSPIPAGAFGDWRTGTKATWSGQSTELTPMERAMLQEKLEHAKAEAERDRERRAQEAAAKAQRMWQAAKECTQHGYLTKKGLASSYGAKLSATGDLMIPVFSAEGRICSLEMITPEGKKKFLPGGAMKGGWFVVGDGAPSFTAEGYATAVSIYEATRKPCLVTFSAGNITAAIESYRKVYPEISALTIVADNDESGVGEKAAYEAKEATGCAVVVIPEKGMDANDYVVAGHDLKTLLMPAVKPYLEPVDVFLSQVTPRSWLVKSWVPAGPAFMMIFGQSGSGKTFFVLDLMLAIATGRENWNGNRVKQGNVVYLCGEGRQGVRERIAAWAQNKGLSSLGTHMVVSQGPTLLDTPDGYARIGEAIRETGLKPDLVVIDTLNRFMSGDENDTRDASAFVAVCDRIQAEYGCCICLIHHVGVSEAAKNRARGSSAFLGALDLQIRVSKSGEVYSAEMSKVKDGKEEAPVRFNLKDVELSGWTDDDGDAIHSAVVDPTTDKPAPAISAQQKKDEDMLLNAVAVIGVLAPEGGVVINRNRWIDFLVDRGRDRKAAQRDLLEGQERKLVSRLSGYGDIVAVSGGWKVVGQLESVARLDINGRLFREASNE